MLPNGGKKWEKMCGRLSLEAEGVKKWKRHGLWEKEKSPDWKERGGGPSPAQPEDGEGEPVCPLKKKTVVLVGCSERKGNGVCWETKHSAARPEKKGGRSRKKKRGTQAALTMEGRRSFN